MSKTKGKTQIEKNLLKKGYEITDIIAKTLQGYIFLGTNKITKKYVIIKVTSMLLHSKKIAIIDDNKTVRVHENIVKEAALMKFLCPDGTKTPKGFIKCIDFFNDGKLYYLVMDYGGSSMHKYVLDNVSKLESKKLNVVGWRQHVQKLFKQMCIYVKWLHDHNVCHMDISLENCTIKDNIVYFCDFGLSEYFRDNINFKCKKYVGKTQYQAPEVYKKSGYFNASSSDIWSLGVVLFLMLTGSPLYKKPSLSDTYFCNLSNGYLKKMVISWGLKNNITDDCYDLLKNIFVNENKRYTIDDVLNHSFVKNIKIY